MDALREEVTNAILEKYEDATEFAIDQAFDFMQKKAFRKTILRKAFVLMADKLMSLDL